MTRERERMGSSPSPSDFERLEKDDGPVINCGELMALFESQERHLHDFFHNLDLEQTQTFAQALLEAPGAVFFSGVGNSGLVALTLSQTLASLGFTRSAYLSPVDALHGNIGSLFPSDILVLISKTGSSEELLNLVPCARAKGARLISITSVKGNPLASRCDMNVHLPLEGGVCPFGLAPFTSSTIQIVFGHTVMAALMRAGKLTKENYARNHPAGKIGKSLIFKVKHLMKKQDELPLCKETDMIMDQLTELTSKACGCLLVVNAENQLIGTFTDGDLRRTLKASGEGIFKLTVGEMCNRNPRTIRPEEMAADAMKKMESPPSAVQFLPVIDDRRIVVGIITLHGLVSAGL
ncbi:probable arabinose 5-phosphate isomerase [Phalaenopsis equestris]|uniref:probable arabinose 5-phosphate isomerase n=1 Tax=Phalaenopsis equestris TaxID=78828 RepID=UPI0009E28D13|nr:probable arabinose 5-phosphate isomerase [Phalaenopsis equestris]